MPWLEHIAIAPLDESEARELLGAEIAAGVADRLIATAAGNPLALQEIPGLLSAGQLAGREPLEDPLRPGTNVERAFAARVSALPRTRGARCWSRPRRARGGWTRWCVAGGGRCRRWNPPRRRGS